MSSPPVVMYATREDVKQALDSAETARNNAQVDRIIRGVQRGIERQMSRHFYPMTDTLYWDWPSNGQFAYPWRLWFDQKDCISITTLTVGVKPDGTGGTVIPTTDYFLEPNRSGPPYTSLNLNLASQSAFTVGQTFQRSIKILGLWGYNADEDAAGALAAAVLTTSATTIDVTDSASIGVGQILRIDTERLTVVGKAQLTTGQTVITSALTANMANDQVLVTDATQIVVDEVITIDTERMRVVDINTTTNALTVKRAWDGSTLAAHNTGTTIYAGRRLTVIRGDLGTTAATHSNAAPIAKHRVPHLIRDLAIAESVQTLVQETAGYTRVPVRGEGSANKLFVSGLSDIRDQALIAHGRQLRQRTV